MQFKNIHIIVQDNINAKTFSKKNKNGEKLFKKICNSTMDMEYPIHPIQ